MTEEWELEWSLGPVQSFIAAARRTRDLWGGSYLLSLLVAKAIAASGLSDEAFVVPSSAVVKSDPLIAACRSRHGGGQPPGDRKLPLWGGLPNHVRVKVSDKKEAGAVAKRMTEAVETLWKSLCDHVWDAFVAPSLSSVGNDPDVITSETSQRVRNIWDRQVNAYWEVTWVVARDDPGALARRKAWRTHLLPDEPGDRCMVQPEYQELSGEFSTTGKDARERQEAFWEALSNTLEAYDLRGDERLCAPVLVKRLWPKVASRVIPGLPDGSSWPSTLHLALAGWLKDAVEQQRHLADELAESIKNTAPEASQVRSGKPLPGMPAHRLWAVDPGILFGPTLYPEVEKVKKQICECIGLPCRYFAIVLADGDRLGKITGQLGSDVVGKALSEFSDGLESIGEKTHSVIVYAGGDDVLAFAPVEGAVCFVEKLEQSYRKRFSEHTSGNSPSPTLSAAVVFSHTRAPLIEAIEAARKLLEEEAKEQNGRASVAIALRHPGGEAARWVRAFSAPDGKRSLERLQCFVKNLGLGNLAVPTSALYRSSELIRNLLAPRPSAPGEQGELVLKDSEALTTLIETELARADFVEAGRGSTPPGTYRRIAENLVELMRPLPGPEYTGATDYSTSNLFDLDVIWLARFLTTRGREEE